MSKPPSTTQLVFNREKLVRVFFFSCFALIVYQMFYLAKPFFTALLLASMMAMAGFPLNHRLRKSVRNPTLVALILTLGVIITATIPLLWMGWFTIREAERLFPTMQNFMSEFQSMDIYEIQEKLPTFLQAPAMRLFDFVQRIDFDIKNWILSRAAMIGAKITALGGFLASHALLGIINLIVLLLTLFFLFKDGERLYNWALSIIPMEEDHKKAIARRAYETFMAVVAGVFITALAQGLVAMFGFIVAGVRLPVLLGVATMVFSLLGASFLITVPVALSYLGTSTWRVVFLLIWGMGVVGILDNFLKPALIGSKARMPFVLIFFSIIGGIKAYGILGFILGPIVVASFLTFVSIYRKGFGHKEEV